jgi:hypothetical protein
MEMLDQASSGKVETATPTGQRNQARQQRMSTPSPTASTPDRPTGWPRRIRPKRNGLRALPQRSP